MSTFHDVIPTEWIAAGESTAVEVAGQVVEVAKVKGEYFAFANACPHQGTELS